MWTSVDLVDSDEDPGATQTPGTPDAHGVETVAVKLSGSLLASPRLFARIRVTTEQPPRPTWTALPPRGPLPQRIRGPVAVHPEPRRIADRPLHNPL